MIKATYYKKTKDGFEKSTGYKFEHDGVTFYIEKVGKAWQATEESTGLLIPTCTSGTRAKTIELIQDEKIITATKSALEHKTTKKAVYELEDYKKALANGENVKKDDETMKITTDTKKPLKLKITLPQSKQARHASKSLKSSIKKKQTAYQLTSKHLNTVKHGQSYVRN